MATPFKGILQDVSLPTEQIVFYSFDPLSWSREVSYGDEPIRGRSEPHVFYAHTGAKIWSVRLYLFASVDQDDGGKPRDIKEKEAFIESLVMPDYGSTPGQPAAVVKPPHLARIKILDMIDAIGTIRNLTVAYQPPYAIDTGFPYQMDVGFSFNVQRVFGKQAPLGYVDVRKLGYRGQDAG